MTNRSPASSISSLGRPDTIAAHESAVEKVVTHMKENLAEWSADLSLNALAREGCYSKSHLIEVFEQVTGTTPHHFLASLRIQRSKELLLKTDLSVTNVALEVGYQSFPTFSRTFSDYVGISPSQFRKMPPIIRSTDLAVAASAFTSKNSAFLSSELIEGRAVLPPGAAGVIFIGTFTRGVPQGRPDSGTVLVQAGHFRIARPPHAEIHLLAALVALPNTGYLPADSILPTLVSTQKICRTGATILDVHLRPTRPTDPPLVVSLPALLDLR